MPFTRAAIMAPSPNPSYVHTHLTSQCKSATPSMFIYCRPPCTTQYPRNVEPWLLSTYLCAHAALAPCASRSLHKSSVKTLLSASYHPNVSTWWAICLWDMQTWRKIEIVNSSSGGWHHHHNPSPWNTITSRCGNRLHSLGSWLCSRLPPLITRRRNLCPNIFFPRIVCSPSI